MTRNPYPETDSERRWGCAVIVWLFLGIFVKVMTDDWLPDALGSHTGSDTYNILFFVAWYVAVPGVVYWWQEVAPAAAQRASDLQHLKKERQLRLKQLQKNQNHYWFLLILILIFVLQ